MVAPQEVMEHKSVVVDGQELDILHQPGISEFEWEEYKAYLQSNPHEARQMLEAETNPDLIRRKNTLNTMADVWRKVMEDDPDEFARKVRGLEEDHEFDALFEDLKAYRWDMVAVHLENRDLMTKVSRRMGGVLREAKMKSEKLRKQPLTLQEACKFGDIRALQRYLSETESDLSMRDIDAEDNKGITCLGYAIGANRLNIVKLLLDNQANPAKVDNLGNSGLHYSAAYGRKEMSEYLLTRGLVDINAKNIQGMTALDCAQRNKQKTTIQLLKEKIGS